MAQEGKEVSENDCQTKPNGIVLVKFTSNCLIYIYIYIFRTKWTFFFFYCDLIMKNTNILYLLSSPKKPSMNLHIWYNLWLWSVGSFAGLGFLSLYLSGKCQAFDRKGHVAKLCIVILPLLVASLVGVSRVNDYWHHWQDVFAGAVLGIILYDQFRRKRNWNCIISIGL